MAKKPISLKTLRERLSYNPETGLFHWRQNWSKGKAGEIAGSPDRYGYIKIGFKGQVFTAHRLAWFYMTGVWPEGNLDHRDCDKTNNAWANLRPATVQQNQMNKKLTVRNTSGLKGAMWNKAAGRWRSIIKFKGEAHFLGYFDSKEEAHAAYAAKAAELHGDFARIN